MLNNFINAPFNPKSLSTNPELSKYIASIGLVSQNDLFKTRASPLPLIIPALNKDIPNGLIMLSSKGKPIPLYAAYDSTHILVEKATVQTGLPLTLSLYPTTQGPVTLTLSSSNSTTTKTYSLEKLGTTSLLSVNFNAPSATSTYTLSVTGAPLPLILTVTPPPPPTPVTAETVKKQPVWKFWGWMQ
jgi:hypothetical protein